MTDERAIRSLLQRTPGDPLGAPYDRAPVGRPPAPLWAGDGFPAKVIDGTTVGQASSYYCSGSSGIGWYIDEVSPCGLAPFNGSRTRTAGGEWICTYVCNIPAFWPIPDGTVIEVSGYPGVGKWRTRIGPLPSLAVVTGISAGAVSAAEWCKANGDSLGAAVADLLDPAIPPQGNPPTDWVWYPQPRVDDLVVFQPVARGVGGGIVWRDTTPRIRVQGAYPAPGGDETIRPLCYDLYEGTVQPPNVPLYTIDKDS